MTSPAEDHGLTARSSTVAPPSVSSIRTAAMLVPEPSHGLPSSQRSSALDFRAPPAPHPHDEKAVLEHAKEHCPFQLPNGKFVPPQANDRVIICRARGTVQYSRENVLMCVRREDGVFVHALEYGDLFPLPLSIAAARRLAYLNIFLQGFIPDSPREDGTTVTFELHTR